MTTKQLEKKITELETKITELQNQLLALALRQPAIGQPYVVPTTTPSYPQPPIYPIITCRGTVDAGNVGINPSPNLQ